MWCGAEMGKRSAGLLIRVPEGTTHVGTATVRDVLRATKAPAKKPSKFHNVSDIRGDVRFDSKREARRYDELVTLQALSPHLTLTDSSGNAVPTLAATINSPLGSVLPTFTYTVTGTK